MFILVCARLHMQCGSNSTECNYFGNMSLKKKAFFFSFMMVPNCDTVLRQSGDFLVVFNLCVCKNGTA